MTQGKCVLLAKHVVVAAGNFYLPRLINVYPYLLSTPRSSVFWLLMKS